MTKNILRLLPVLLLCVAVAAGCATKQGSTQEDMAAAEEAVPEETMAGEEVTGDEAAMAGETVETARVEEGDLAADDLEKAVKGLATVHFDFDRYNIKPDEAEILRNNARWLRQNRGVEVVIEGHADERGETEYNLALGEKRAKSVKDYLVGLGVSSSRLKTISYGEEKPADPRHNEAAWAKNRRAEFTVAD